VSASVSPLPLSNSSLKALLKQQIYTKQQKNCWTCHFACGPCRFKEKQAISSSQNVLFNTNLWWLISDSEVQTQIGQT
jgi:hypothetical protein